MRKGATIRIRVAQSMKDDLEAIAKTLQRDSVSDVTASDVGRKAIEEYLERHRPSSVGKAVLGAATRERNKARQNQPPKV